MTTKNCLGCGTTIEVTGPRVRCEPCRRDHVRWLRRRPEAKLKTAAVQKVRHAILTGRLVRLPCEKCGRAPAQAHHDDYSKPLEVRWLCTFHHAWHHSRELTHANVDRSYT